MLNLTKKKIERSKHILFTFLTTLLLLSPIAYADAQIIPCGPNARNPAASADNASGCTILDIITLLQNIYNFLLGLAAFVALAFLIWGGIQMFSPSPNSVESGKKTLMYAITGLVIIILSYLIVNTLIVVLSGNGTTMDALLSPLQGS